VNRLISSLFGRTALALGAAFFLLQSAALMISWKLVMQPMAERSADDLAALVVLAAQTWVELPPITRPDFERELSARHHLRILSPGNPMTGSAEPFYLRQSIEHALGHRLGRDMTLLSGEAPGWAWAEIHLAGHRLRIGFPTSRYGVQLPLAAIWTVLAGALLVLATALFMAGRTSRQLRAMSGAAGVVGQGQIPERLPERGPSEIRDLAAAFNLMASRVQELLTSRTTLLSGISHDLRTPIARLRIALEMLKESPTPRLLARMESDLEEMNNIISTMLEFARSLRAEPSVSMDVAAMLHQLAESADGQAEVHVPPRCICHAPPLALKRIVSNLLQNALRYGDGKVELHCEEQGGTTRIRVLDSGPGIPEPELDAVFQPFYRLEGSRSRETGGSGLGLAIAKQLADAHGWRLSLANRAGGGLEAALSLRDADNRPAV
jgi:two-component system, OmpR family, osmolarity sensor histidine kinase EnvZ